MRPAFSLLICASMVPLVACDRKAGKRDGDKIDLDQNVTVDQKPKDPVFADFEKNWRKFISPSTELAQPVYVDPKRPRERWTPVVSPECVNSPAAGGPVAQVTLTWNEAMEGGLESAGVKQSLAAQQVPAATPAPAGTPRLRFDLALHQNGFGRNYYTAILASDTQQRFMLPSNSGLASDPQAVVLTGPGLFPRLADFRTEVFVDAAVRQQFLQHTMVLEDLSQGLTYTIRLDRPAANQWNEERRFSFFTPICPREF